MILALIREIMWNLNDHDDLSLYLIPEVICPQTVNQVEL